MGYECVCFILENMKSSQWLNCGFGLRKVGGETDRVVLGWVV